MSQNEPEIRVSASDALEFEPVTIKTSKLSYRIRVSFLVLFAVGCGAVGWEFYGSKILGIIKVQNKEVPIIRADNEVFKLRPENPGGIEVRDREKLVYSPIHKSAGGLPMAIPAERLLPLPEKPLLQELKNLDSENNKITVGPSNFPTPPEKPKYITEAPRAIDVTSAKKPENPPLVPKSDASNILPGSTVENEIISPEIQKSIVGTRDTNKKNDNKSIAERKAQYSLNNALSDKTNVTSPDKFYKVQLAATRTMRSANAVWLKLRKSNTDLLGDLKMKVTKVDLGKNKGIFFRLRVGPFEARDEARALCNLITKRKIGCLVVKPGS